MSEPLASPFANSVTQWIGRLKQGEDEAAGRLWERYFEQLVGVARRKMGSAERRVADEEDVALLAFQALCEGAAAGRFTKLSNREDLWSLMVAIASKKAVDQVRRQTSDKRGGGGVRGNSIFASNAEGAERGFEDVLSQEPTPEFLTLIEEQHAHLLNVLPDELMQAIVKLRLAGFNNDEIAKQAGVSLRSVERKLRLIRELWSKELGA